MLEGHFENFIARNTTGRYIMKGPRRQDQNRLRKFIWWNNRMVSRIWRSWPYEP